MLEQSNPVSLALAHDFYLRVNWEGSILDVRELEISECFVPELLRQFSLGGISRFVREAATFVGLHSCWRGRDRFTLLFQVLELLKDRRSVGKRGVTLPPTDSLRDWLTRVGFPPPEAGSPSQIDGSTWAELTSRPMPNSQSLAADPLAKQDEVLAQCLEWSQAVDKSLEELGERATVFPGVRESLHRLEGTADIVLVSQPGLASAKSTRPAGLTSGQCVVGYPVEETLSHAQNYLAGQALYIGDSLLDARLAKANGFLFFPILPGKEEASWHQFHLEALSRFLDGSYAGKFEERLVGEFEKSLSEIPPWKVKKG